MCRRLLAVSLALASMLFLSSCLDYEEEMTLHDDLSGELSVVLTLPDTLITKYEKIGPELDRAKIEKRLETVSGVRLAGYENISGRHPVIKMRFTFSSLEKLDQAIAANAPAAVWGGRFTITKEADKIKIDRKLGVGDIGNDLPELNTLIYKTHFDPIITATNSPQYNSPAQDVRFRYKLGEVLSNQPSQTTTVLKGWPWKLLLISVAAVAAVAWYGWEYFGKKKR